MFPTAPYGRRSSKLGFPVASTEIAAIGHLLRFLTQLDRAHLLICDELGYVTMSRGGVELLFRVFADREAAIEEMGKHDGHGWVVLCSVTPGTRAVPEA